MTTEQFELELEKMRREQKRHDDEFKQRNKHWVRQQVFWTVIGLAATVGATATLIKIFGV